MRLAPSHGEPASGVRLWSIGRPFPARQHVEASKAVASFTGSTRRAIFAAQSEEAIAAGAFHNDVVAVANGPVLFAHEKAFADRDAPGRGSRCQGAGVRAGRSLDAEVPLADAISSYLFNAQLVTPPDGAMTLFAPTECRDTPSVAGWIERHLARTARSARVKFVDVRQSMANGGGPACLRLRVQCDPALVDPRFLVDDAKLDRLADVIATLAGTNRIGRNSRRIAGRCGQACARSYAGSAGWPSFDSSFWDSQAKRLDPTQFFSYRGTVKGQLTTVLNRERAERRHSRGVCLTNEDAADRSPVCHQDAPGSVSGDLCHRRRRDRTRHPLQSHPGNAGLLLAAACLGVPFIAGAKLLDSVRPGSEAAIPPVISFASGRGRRLSRNRPRDRRPARDLALRSHHTD